MTQLWFIISVTDRETRLNCANWYFHGVLNGERYSAHFLFGSESWLQLSEVNFQVKRFFHINPRNATKSCYGWCVVCYECNFSDHKWTLMCSAHSGAICAIMMQFLIKSHAFFQCIYLERITKYGLVIHKIRINAIFKCTACYRINRILIILALKVMWKKALRREVGRSVFNFTRKTLTWNEPMVYYVWRVPACLRKPLLPYKLTRIRSKFQSVFGCCLL